MLDEVQSLGASIVAISPQIPAQSQVSVEKSGVTFHILSDPGNSVARKFRLVFSLPSDLREVYLKLGIDLPVVNGDGSWELPIPSTFVIATDGVITARSAEGDYVPRMEPQEIVAALRAM